MTLALAAQQNQNPLANALAIPVVGAVTGAVTGTFNGTANIRRFAIDRSTDQLVALGTLTGVVTNAAGQVVQSLVANFSVPTHAYTGLGTAQDKLLRDEFVRW